MVLLSSGCTTVPGTYVPVHMMGFTYCSMLLRTLNAFQWPYQRVLIEYQVRVPRNMSPTERRICILRDKYWQRGLYSRVPLWA